MALDTIALLNAKLSSLANDLIWVVETQTLYIYVPTGLAVTADSKYIASDTSVPAARWKGVAGKYVYQHQGVMRTFTLITDINVETHNYADKLAYVVERDTLYKYVPSAMSAIPVDNYYMLADTPNVNARWQGVAGKYIYLNFNQNSYVAKTLNIPTPSAGTFVTGHVGTPIVQAFLWDNALNKYQMIDSPSYSVDVSSNGASVDYDFTGVSMGGSDFVKLVVIYHDLVANLSNEFDSGWIDFAAINNLPSAGWHRMDLPSGFTTYPPGYTLTFNNGTEIRPGELPDRVVFSQSGGTFRIAVYVADLIAGQTFRVTASMAARPTGNLLSMEQYIVTAAGALTQPSGNAMYKANIGAPVSSALPAASVVTGFLIMLKNPTAFDWTLTSAQNIDGVGSIVLAASNHEAAILISDGSTYHRFS
jgi:hypothetical protein